MPDDYPQSELDDEIYVAHERLVSAMHSRLPDMSANTKERYVAVLSSLADKLEDSGKTLREVAREMLSEAAGFLLPDLGRWR